jgi:prolyl oligopeptidase
LQRLGEQLYLHSNRRRVAAGALFLLSLCSAAARADGPPLAAQKPVTERFFGTQVTDPYRWMEDEKSPEFRTYMKQQSDWTRQALDQLPGRAALEQRIVALDNAAVLIGGMQRVGREYFYMKSKPGSKSPALVVREGEAGAERVLVDPDAMNEAGTHVSIDYYTPSLDGKYVAYALATGGSEESTLHVLETASGKDLSDRIDRARFGNVSWREDGTSFFYNRLAALAPGEPDTDKYKDSRVYLHVLGDEPAHDRVVFGAGVDPAIAVLPTEIPAVYVTPGSKQAVAVLNNGVQNELTIYVAPLDKLDGAHAPWVKVAGPSDDVTNLTVKGDRLYLLSHRDAARFKVLETSAVRPDVAHAKVVVPAGQAVIQSVAAAADALYVQELDGGIGRLRRVPYDGGAPATVKLPVDGALDGLYTDPRIDGPLFSLEGWVVSRAWYRYDPKSGTVADTGILPRSSVDASAYAAQEVKAKSADGTEVPLSIVYRKDAKLDGSHPTLLRGYGAYGITLDPAFAPTYFALLERDGVWATCHVRGGGEYGEDWHRAGQKLTKQHSIDDLIACSQYLIDQGWTTPARLAINGGSAGGILVGGALTQRPDLFRVVLDEVGVSNALRSEFTENGPPNIPEFGSVTTPEGFKALYAMDATQHVKPGVAYPAVMLTTGINDPRVPSFESAKMAAHLQAATSSGRPVLLRVDYDAGHGIGSTKAQRDHLLADKFAFMFWQFGMPGFQPAQASAPSAEPPQAPASQP